MTAIELRNIGKCFNISKRSFQSLLFNSQLDGNTKVWALKDISFSIKKGECVGIIGDNGSGKSTLLRVIAGITVPSEGSLKIDGSLNSFLELGIGFQGELSGKENIFFYGLLLGFKKEEIKKMYKDIADFSGLKEAIEQQVRTYSSGMLARLAFSVLAFTNSDIMLFDEVMSVGDYSFKQKSVNKLLEFKSEGKTLLIASHDPYEILKICDKCILLEKGRLVLFGDAKSVIDTYVYQINKKIKFRLSDQIKEEESKNYNSTKLLYLYKELNTVLENIIRLKENAPQRLHEEGINDLIAQCEERVNVLEKIIRFYNKKRTNKKLKKEELLTFYENLICSINDLQGAYEYSSDQNSVNNRTKKVKSYKKQIRLLKKVIKDGRIFYSEHELIRFYGRLMNIGLEFPSNNKNEKKQVLSNIKEALQHGIRTNKNSKSLLVHLHQNYRILNNKM